MGQTLDQETLDEIVGQIVKVLDPEKIILFGSYARGGAGPDSDVDIAVIAETAEPRGRRTLALAPEWPPVLVPSDILVFTPDEWESSLDLLNTIPNEAAREGRVLYERSTEPAAVG